ncbi:MAG: hypothetical protein KU28_01175 [Sulfurovum sp. PC08-66]|nr:MAG: hypothetical protein KU28_01175 [Sulfurovum sp. PC08-66]KIM12568.1 MAG: hypothetical protein KU37_01290 [Sulfuricurvum sp. PC08-66]
MTSSQMIVECLPKFPSLKMAYIAAHSDEALLSSVEHHLSPLSGSVRIFEMGENMRLGTREYEVLIWDAPTYSALQLKTIFRALENSGLFLLRVGSAQENISQAKALLEEVGFVAINATSLDDALLLSAKKMHGWSHGQ